MTQYKIYNPWHLGDAFYNLQFARKLCLHNPEIGVVFHSNESQEEMTDYIEPELRDRIILQPLGNIEQDPTAHNGWIGRDDRRFLRRQRKPWNWDVVQFNFSAYLAGIMGLPSPFQEKADVLFDSPQINRPNSLSQPVDYLVINGVPRSMNQGWYRRVDLEVVIEALVRKGKRVVTTDHSRVAGTICTRDHGLTLTGIGQVAVHARHVIGIHTGPLHPCFNPWSLPNVQSWHVLSDSGESFSWSPHTYYHKDHTTLLTMINQGLHETV